MRTAKANQTTVVTKHHVEIEASDIRQLLIEKGIWPNDVDAREVRMYMMVPGGGDWSNTELYLDGRENTIHVRWEIREDNTEGNFHE